MTLLATDSLKVSVHGRTEEGIFGGPGRKALGLWLRDDAQRQIKGWPVGYSLRATGRAMALSISHTRRWRRYWVFRAAGPVWRQAYFKWKGWSAMRAAVSPFSIPKDLKPFPANATESLAGR